MKTIAFTGHRPAQLGGYVENNPVQSLVKNRLNTIIVQACNAGYTNFITGMAMGVDQWAANMVIDIKNKNPEIKLIAAVPFAQQANVWAKETKKQWLHILSCCDEIYLTDIQPNQNINLDELITLSNQPMNDAKYTINTKLLQRNEWMVDRADTVIAVCKQNSGGTAKCIEYAYSKNKKIVIYNPDEDSIVNKHAK